jgi:hypothetical protein
MKEESGRIMGLGFDAEQPRSAHKLLEGARVAPEVGVCLQDEKTKSNINPSMASGSKIEDRRPDVPPTRLLCPIESDLRASTNSKILHAWKDIAAALF